MGDELTMLLDRTKWSLGELSSLAEAFLGYFVRLDKQVTTAARDFNVRAVPGGMLAPFLSQRWFMVTPALVLEQLQGLRAKLLAFAPGAGDILRSGAWGAVFQGHLVEVQGAVDEIWAAIGDKATGLRHERPRVERVVPAPRVRAELHQGSFKRARPSGPAPKSSGYPPQFAFDRVKEVGRCVMDFQGHLVGGHPGCTKVPCPFTHFVDRLEAASYCNPS